MGHAKRPWALPRSRKRYPRMHVVARRPHRELHRATQKFKLRHYFLLTRVTRIFQKSVFTKAAPASPGEMPLPGFFVAQPPPPSAVQLSSVGVGRGRSCPVSGLLFTGSSTTSACCLLRSLAPGRASCFLPGRSDEWPGRQNGCHERAKGEP